MSALPTVLGMSLVTYSTRLAGLWLRVRPPPFWARVLRFVPTAVFAALVVPALPGPQGWEAARLVAAGAAGLAAWRVRQLWAGLAVGMGVYWLLR
jgi:branched-subunit amino acid transport protein